MDQFLETFFNDWTPPRIYHVGFVSIDINQVIGHAIEFTKTRWKNEAESKGIIIKVEKSLMPVPPIAGSASELREVFTNLIHNAIDAMPQGGSITIRSFKEAHHVCVCVEDTGIGIPPIYEVRCLIPSSPAKGYNQLD